MISKALQLRKNLRNGDLPVVIRPNNFICVVSFHPECLEILMKPTLGILHCPATMNMGIHISIFCLHFI